MQILNLSNESLRSASFLLPLLILAFFIVMTIMSLSAKKQRSHLKLLLISLLLFVFQYFIYLQINAEKLAIPYFPIAPEIFYSALPLLLIIITIATYKLLSRFGNFDALIYIVVVTISWLGLLVLLRLSLDLIKLPTLAFKSSIIVFSGILVIPATVILLRRRQEWLILRRTTYTWLMLSAFLLVVTVFIGRGDHSIKIYGAFRIQPIELVKIFYILFIAGYCASFGEALNSLKRASLSLAEYLRFALPLLVAWFSISMILFFQKDIGPIMTLSLFSFAMLLYIAPRRELTILITGSLVILLCAAYTLGGAEYKDIFKDAPYLHYAVEKFRVRLDSCLYPFKYSETISRSLWAISSGYLTGTGMGLSECHRIPEVHNDLIYSALINEMGAAVGIAVILGYFTILISSARIAISSRDIYVKTISNAVGLLIFTEAALITAGTLSIIPLTGITLPFVSAGGASYSAHCILIGLLMYLSAKKEEVSQ